MKKVQMITWEKFSEVDIKKEGNVYYKEFKEMIKAN